MIPVLTFVEEVNPLIAQAAKEPEQSTWLDELEGRLQSLENRLGGMTQTASQLVKAAENASTVDYSELEDMIQLLEKLEQSLGADLSRLRLEQDHWADLLHRHTRDARHRFSRFIGNLERAMVRTAEAIRDARWRLLAIQAQIEKEGTAPVFDDPDALERYLGKG
jgi:uncharacterized protein YigA (DUF484 family)